jgi:hypothetical protein
MMASCRDLEVTPYLYDLHHIQESYLNTIIREISNETDGTPHLGKGERNNDYTSPSSSFKKEFDEN